MIASAVVFGASSGIGRATARALAAQGAKVWAVARRPSTPGERIEVVVGDATDPAVVARVLDDATPDLVVVSVGVEPRMAPIEDQRWEDFSSVWNADLRASFEIGKHTLRRPLRRGATVVIVSSGAALGGSPLSGGYAGAKRMQMFLASYLQQRADALDLGVRYVALAPKQLLTDTPIGEGAASSYAAAAGLAVDDYRKRFGVPLDADGVAAGILAIAGGTAPAGTILTITGANGLAPL